MKFKTLEIIKGLDEQFKMGYNIPILKGYVAVSKRGVEKLIDDIYANLPEDVKAAREFLKNQEFELEKISQKRKSSEGKSIYDTLKGFEAMLDTTISVVRYSILSIREVEQLIDQLHETLPEEIKVAEKMK